MDTKEDVAVKIEKDTNDYLNQLEKTVPEHKEQVIASTIQINNFTFKYHAYCRLSSNWSIWLLMSHRKSIPIFSFWNSSTKFKQLVYNIKFIFDNKKKI